MIARYGLEENYYIVRNSETGELMAGTEKRSVPKLYRKGSATSIANANNYLRERRGLKPVWEVVPVKITLAPVTQEA